jgi:hypothetical protein
MAAFEDNNPFASPSSPSSSRATSYAPFTAYPFSPSTPTQHQTSPSFDSTNRPTTSSSEDQPFPSGGGFRAGTNSDYSEQPPLPEPVSAGDAGKEGEACCRIDEILRKNPEMRIVITDAGKASDGGANFIAYTIDVGVRSLSSHISVFICVHCFFLW